MKVRSFLKFTLAAAALVCATVSTAQTYKSEYRMSLVPVSYTHLDVYKRQLIQQARADINFVVFLGTLRAPVKTPPGLRCRGVGSNRGCPFTRVRCEWVTMPVPGPRCPGQLLATLP